MIAENFGKNLLFLSLLLSLPDTPRLLISLYSYNKELLKINFTLFLPCFLNAQ